MKTTVYATMLAVGTLGLAVPAFAADEAPAAAAEAAVAADTVAVTTILVEGAGWGVDKRVRAALTSLEGIDKMVLSGFRASIVMKDGKSLDKDKVKAAVEAKRLKFISMEDEKIALPETAWTVDVAGATWAATNEKARVALEKMEAIEMAFVDGGVTLFMAAGHEADQEAISALLKANKMTVKGFKKAESTPF